MSFDALLRPYGLSFSALQTREGLQHLDEQFTQYLPPKLRAQLLNWRQQPDQLNKLDTAEFQILLGQYLNQFLAQVFGLEQAALSLQISANAAARRLQFKARYIQKGVKRYRETIQMPFSTAHAHLLQHLPPYDTDLEQAIADYGLGLSEGSPEEQALIQWAVLASTTSEGRALTQHWISFKLPERIDSQNLVPYESDDWQGLAVKKGYTLTQRRRDGFSLTDTRYSRDQVASEIDYCKYCHDHEGDFCSKGFPQKKGSPELGFKSSPFNQPMTGCPLEEKISEMQRLQKEGHTLGALAMIMVDNPMVAATGHRICNDCMKACIYQKQEPVNIPQIETRIVTDVLNLKWGVEIYLLLTRWNPLKAKDFLPAPPQQRRILVVGLGPAGFTLLHYLSQAGYYVVGIDGLKIEPLPAVFIDNPIQNWQQLEENLDERILMGFGGVAEYGITVRWDKNFLKLIYLMLARRSRVQIIGGVRFGGTLTLKQAFELGFDHVSLAVGAGLPRVLNIENSMARGMRQASDFLMAMQLTGAAKQSSLANLQIRLPAVVIGGGLTAVDTATEVQAYYIKQVEKILERVETLGDNKVRQHLSDEDQLILDEFLTHGRMVRAERERAILADDVPNFTPLIHSWGGVLLAYRKTMTASPAYTLNHEELTKAFQEGIFYGENLDPQRVEIDQYGHLSGITFTTPAGTQTVQARSVLVAAGTVPNHIYATEYPDEIILENNHFQGYSTDGIPIETPSATHAKSQFAPFVSYQYDERRVTYLGDSHPVFNGNVVKAITSAKRTAPIICDVLTELPIHSFDEEAFTASIQDLLTARIAQINTQNPAVTEVWIKAPLAARNFQPGQFFRLQTFEHNSKLIENTRLQIPTLTVSGIGVKEDCIRLMVLQWGAAPRLISHLSVGQQVILAGPTGAPAEIPHQETILVIAGRWGAAVMLDLGQALRATGNKVIYLATFDQVHDIDKMDELEAGADQIIWCISKGDPVIPRRSQDLSVSNQNVIELIQLLHKNHQIHTKKIDRIMAMGSTGLLKALQTALSANGTLTPLFKPEVIVTGTVGSPMQCMMKGVCGQCLQWHIDPSNGKRTQAVFSCAGQDQPLKAIDLDNLAARTSQNRLVDHIGSLWLTHILQHHPLPKDN